MSILIRGMDMPEKNERIRIEICGDGRVLWTHRFKDKINNNPNKWLGIRFYAEHCQELGRPQDVNVLIHKIVGAIIEVGQSDGKFKLGEIIRYTPAEILRILTEHEDQIFGKEPSAEQLQDSGWQQDEFNNNSTEVNKKNDELISREDALNFRVNRALQEDGIVYVPMKEVKDYLRGLPSAQPEQAECIQDTKAVPDDRDMVCLSERVTATYYDVEHEEWSQKTVTIADVLDSVCDDYTVLPSAQPNIRGVIDESGRIKFIEQPERKKGKWIYVERKEPQYDIAGVRTWAVVYKCSECGFLHTVIENSGIYDYCPNCGTEMEVEG